MTYTFKRKLMYIKKFWCRLSSTIRSLTKVGIALLGLGIVVSLFGT